MLNNIKRVGAQIEESLKSVEKEVVFCEFNGECTKAEITRVMDVVTENNCDVVIGVGGGKVIDTAKAVVTNLGGYQLVIIPTVASNDSPCSGVAVIYNDEGVVIKALIRIWYWLIPLLSPSPPSACWLPAWAMLWLPGLKHVPARHPVSRPWPAASAPIPH